MASDYKEARRWYQEALHQGEPEAQFKLGMMYIECDSVTRNDANEVDCFQ